MFSTIKLNWIEYDVYIFTTEQWFVVFRFIFTLVKLSSLVGQVTVKKQVFFTPREYI